MSYYTNFRHLVKQRQLPIETAYHCERDDVRSLLTRTKPNVNSANPIPITSKSTHALAPSASPNDGYITGAIAASPVTGSRVCAGGRTVSEDDGRGVPAGADLRSAVTVCHSTLSHVAMGVAVGGKSVRNKGVTVSAGNDRGAGVCAGAGRDAGTAVDPPGVKVAAGVGVRVGELWRWGF